MNEQLSSSIRTLLKVAGGVLVTKGVVDSSGLELLAAAVTTIIGIVWSYYTHRAEKPAEPTKPL